MKKLALLALLMLAACDQASTTATPAAPATPVADLSGEWTGPEGTYIVIGPDSVKIRDLDGEKIYAATHTDKGVTFTRNGIMETLRPGDGRPA